MNRGTERISATIELYKAVGRGPNRAIGPFGHVEIRHRRLIGDGVAVALRHVDGLWREPTAESGAAFLAARVSASGRSVAKLRLVEGWKAGSDFTTSIREVRLQGDDLYIGRQAKPFAHTVDKERIWQTWADGLAYRAATVGA